MFHQAVVEFQAFQSNSNALILKELAIISDWSVTVVVFSSPYPKNKLNRKMLKTAYWLETHYHGIAWSHEGIAFNSKLMKSLLAPFNVIYTKGLQKVEFLSKFHNNVLDIYFDTNKADVECSCHCIIAQHRYEKTFMCALRSATQYFEDLKKSKSS